MGMEASIADLRQAVERLHACRASLSEVVRVREHFRDEAVWEGTVHVFDISDHPKASVCYAWSAKVDNSDRRRFYAVLGEPPINSAADAVRASIVVDHKG